LSFPAGMLSATLQVGQRERPLLQDEGTARNARRR
jgi:hypothetical protein